MARHGGDDRRQPEEAGQFQQHAALDVLCRQRDAERAVARGREDADVRLVAIGARGHRAADARMLRTHEADEVLAVEQLLVIPDSSLAIVPIARSASPASSARPVAAEIGNTSNPTFGAIARRRHARTKAAPRGVPSRCSASCGRLAPI
jgi:hypothetical protein